MKKKDAILKAATVLFAHQGYRETSMQELARLTGVAEGTIFYHYSSKTKLLLSILDKTRESIVSRFEEFFRERSFDSGMSMVEETVSFYLYLAGLLEDQFLLLHRHSVYKLAETHPEFRQDLEAIYNCLADFFEKGIVQGQRDGSVNPEVQSRKTALIIFTMADGLVRFKNYNLYDAGALFNEVLNSCRRMLQSDKGRAEC